MENSNLKQCLSISVLTLFPDFYSSFMGYSLFQKAMEINILKLKIIDIRQFSENKHKKCDDIPYGGGSGMVMTPQPVRDAILAARKPGDLVIALSARGVLLDQNLVKLFVRMLGLFEKEEGEEADIGKIFSGFGMNRLPQKWQEALMQSEATGLVLVCGHYEGIDQRALDLYSDLELSIGSYILSGGEIASLVLIETICRYIRGFIGNQDSLSDESFETGLLEYPQYTRPAIFDGEKVPDVLLSGHHKNIKTWREDQKLISTRARRPDILKKKIKKKN